jgi:hypothetical protein
VLWELHRKDEAVAQLQKALALDATFAPARQKLNEIMQAGNVLPGPGST